MLNITATTSGFFVNRTYRDTFNPQPLQPLMHAYSLVSLLALASSSFKKNYVLVRDALFAEESGRLLCHASTFLSSPFAVASRSRWSC